MSASMASGRRAMPVPEWPQADQAGWRLANQPEDLLDDSVGYARRWRPATRKLTQDGYGYWLDWLDRTGQLVDLGRPRRAGHARPPARLPESNARRRLAPYTVATRIQQVGNALRAIAPGNDWVWLLKAASRLRGKATPVRDKRIGMQPAEDVEKPACDMMHAAEHDRFRSKVERAVLFRDGLLLAMLVARPLRRANITSVEIGRQLRRDGEHWRLCFDKDEMRAPRHFQCSVPEKLTKHVNRYIELHRPILLQCSRRSLAPTSALWISKQGTHMTSSAVAFQITARMREEFGEPINPHKFRHIYDRYRHAYAIANRRHSAWTRPRKSESLRGVLQLGANGGCRAKI